MSTDAHRIIRDEIRSESAYHVQPAGGMVKLDAMENPYELPEQLRQELARLLSDAPLNRYPDPQAPMLKTRLRQTMRIPDGFDLLLGNGSDEIIQVMVQACARPGATVLALAPSFMMYRMYALIAGVQFHSVPLEPDFSLDREKILAAVRKARPAVIFISYPNNPTGNLFPDDVMQAILREAPGLVVVDEAYQPFAGSTYLDRIEEHPNLVVLRTLSKLGLAGIRLGYAVGRPEWIREFDKVRSPYNVNVLTQIVAERVLAHYDVLERQAAAICTDRERLAVDLAGMPGFAVFPSRANFLLVRVPDATRLFELLRRRNVLVKNLHGAHPVLDQCLRITIGTPAENQLLISALKAGISEDGDGTGEGVRVR